MVFLKTSSISWPTLKPVEVVGILYYILRRLDRLKKVSDDFVLMANLSIQSFEQFYGNIIHYLSDDEPQLFSFDYSLPATVFVWSKLYSLQFYNYRLDEVLKELSYMLLSRIPVLNANRLYLLWALVQLKQATNSTVWDEQIEILHSHIDSNKIIFNELKSKDVSIRDGLAGIYLLLSDLDKTPYRVDFDKDLIIRRFEESDVWKNEQWRSMPFGLINGISGALLIYSSIINNKKS
jgi:hypothetical protein